MSSIIAIVASIVTILGVGGTAVASNSANPGEILYPVDTLLEQIQRTLTADPVKAAELELKLLDERVLELKSLSTDGTAEDVETATKLLEQQQLRIQERVQEMNQLREQNKLQSQDQLKVMEQLKTAVAEHQSTLNEVKSTLSDKGNTDASKAVDTINSAYGKELAGEVTTFETETGLEVKESESNSGEDTQIQNQNQTQNSGDTSGGSTSGSGSTNSNTNKGK